jgi:hypothetical protein
MTCSYKAIVCPKKGEPFMLMVGSTTVDAYTDGFCVMGITLDEGVVQKTCRISVPRPNVFKAKAAMALVAERHQRAGATLIMNSAYMHQLDHRNVPTAELDRRIVEMLLPDWTETCGAGARPGDIVASAFTKIAEALRLGPP